MILTADSAQLIYKFILQDKSYEEILSKFVTCKNERNEFRQTMWQIICEQPEEKIIHSWNEKFFKYWYVSVCKNQIQSNTSPWAKQRNSFQTSSLEDYEAIDHSYTYEDKDNQNFQNTQLNTIKDALNYWSKKDPLFRVEKECFELYYHQSLSYRKISKKTGIPTPSVYNYVQSAKTKIKGFITNKRYIN